MARVRLEFEVATSSATSGDDDPPVGACNGFPGCTFALVIVIISARTRGSALCMSSPAGAHEKRNHRASSELPAIVDLMLVFTSFMKTS